MTVTCGYASDNGEAPNLHDNHNVWNNANTDGNFGVSSPIVLWDLSPDGLPLGALHVPSNEIVTSFSSKSELALNRSADGKSLTFMGYRGGPGCPALTLDTTTNILTQGTNVGPVSPTAANLLDVSASSTPGLCDPTNPAVASYAGANNPTAYYRSVAEVDASGPHLLHRRRRLQRRQLPRRDQGRQRAVLLGRKRQQRRPFEEAGARNAARLRSLPLDGRRTVLPGAAPLVPPDNNMISYFVIASGDKPGKDTNFRGETIFNDTLYVAKGSGGNGINTVYQLGTPGVLPTTGNAPAGGLNNEPYTILPGFPNTLPPPPARAATILLGFGSRTIPLCTFATKATWSTRRTR